VRGKKMDLSEKAAIGALVIGALGGSFVAGVTGANLNLQVLQLPAAVIAAAIGAYFVPKFWK